MNGADQKLVARLLAGNECAFDQFFDTYFEQLWCHAMQRLDGDVDRSREVVQFTLVHAMRKLHAYRGEASLFAWLCEIAGRECLR